MPGVSKEQKLANIHAEALIEFDQIQSVMKPERQLCLEDRRFYSIPGAQYEGKLEELYENKPKFEVNKGHLAVIRIFNEYRNNRITVDFTNKDGAKDDKLADVCDGLYRADEQDSGAEEAYDNGFEEAVGGGFGAYRLRAVYEDEYDEDNDHQRIRIEPIYDADSCVFFDLGAKRQDKADAKRCFVLTGMTPETYRAEYGDDPSSWPKDITCAKFDWASPNVVFVAEYYRVEESKTFVRTYKDAMGNEEKYREPDFEQDEELEETLLATGRKLIKEKKVKVKKIHKYLMSGGKILEDCGFIAGDCIPIVPIYGKRWFVDNIERCMGHIRLVKDVQRLKNMQLSKLAEISALSSIGKPILTPEQIAGHQVYWAEDNIKNYPYLLINPITDAQGQQMPAGPVAFTQPPQVPPAMAALLQITEQDMNDILGNQQQGEQIKSNISGKAVEMIQTALGMQTYIYMSNFAKAVRRGGEIWLSMARELYVEDERSMKTIGSRGETGNVKLMKPILSEEGAEEYENDLTRATFDVVSEVGPSSTSRRDATVRALTNMIGVAEDPETRMVLQSMAMLNLEGEGISDVHEYFRSKLINMGAVKPTEEEAQMMAAAKANQPEDPNTTLANALAEEAKANAVKARVQTVDTLAASQLKNAQTEKTRAEAAEVVSGITLADQSHAIKALESLGGNRPTAQIGEQMMRQE